ncbi:HEAT repeat domain-containing protein, partial [Acaryochloris sp. IP29b_bin.137]|uniref:HEAT repeat domain-containing protein n=1 Tax=Acaryochloris sp. IP29b_bin.137 TaxID=2969217 RepID=UPI00261F56EA
PGLLKFLEDPDFSVRRSAVEALADLKTEAAIPELLKLLEDPDFSVRRSAVQALASLKTEAAIPGLLKLLEDPDSSVRWSAVEALAIFENLNLQAIMLLTKFSYDSEADLRRRAVQILGNIDNEAVIDPLIKILRVRGPDLRKLAAEGLGSICSENSDVSLSRLNQSLVIISLAERLNDSNGTVRKAVAKALEMIDNAKIINILQRRQQQAVYAEINTVLASIQERFGFYNYQLTEPLSRSSEIPKYLLQSSDVLSSNLSTKVMQILHLSDLHICSQKQAQLWGNQIAEDLKNELQITTLQALILSGDIANYASSEEYNAAQSFITALCQEFHLQPDQIVLTPGNHDIDWATTDWNKAEDVAYKLKQRSHCQPQELKEGNFIEEGPSSAWICDENQYFQRFANFSTFYQAIKGQPYPLNYEQQYTLDFLPAGNLLILGLNSAWQLDHHFRDRVSIQMGALSNALTELRQSSHRYDNSLKIAVWHHPLNSPGEDRIKEHGFLEQLAVAGFRYFLHGHVHQAKNNLYRYDMSPKGRKLDGIVAGTFGAPTRELIPGYPWQYNLLTIDSNQLTVRTRRREEVNGSWKPDARWSQGPGQSPLDFYTLEL